MKRLITYSLLALLIVFAQVNFNAVDRAAVVLQGAINSMLHISDEITTNTQRVVDGDIDIREAAVNTGKEVSRVITPKPLIVDGGQNIDDTHLTTTGVVIETNIARALNGMSPLKENALLAASAHAKAQDMYERQYFAHISPTGEGPSDVVSDAGYSYILVGENLAMGVFEDDEDLVQAWMDSPGHRANILHDRFTEIGIGIVRGEYQGKEVWFAVQEFGLPRSACPLIQSALQAQIEQNQQQLEIWEEDLVRMKKEIDDSEERGKEYRNRVEEYNALIDEFNTLVEETKEAVSEYNKQVREYNACIEGTA